MKKSIFFAAVAAIILSACAKIENFDNRVEGQNQIGFTNYVPRSIVKADPDNYASGTTLVNDADFDVWGWYTANGTSFTGSNGTAFFSGWYTVTYQDGGGYDQDGSANLYPDGARYWPSGDTPDLLSFYAYYPSDAGTISAPSTGLGAFDFTAEATAADQVDFMIADVVKDQVYGNTNSSHDGTVALNFKHQLTKVQVKFKTTAAIVSDANTDIEVTSAAFGNIVKSGTLTSSFNGTATSTAWTDNAYSGDAAILASYDIAVPSGALTATAANSGDDDDDVFLLVPQTMVAPTRNASGAVTSDTAAQFITVTWTVTTDGVATQNTKKIYLDECVTTDGGSTQANIDWAKNNFVTYIITIAPNQILFNAQVTSWDNEVLGYYNLN